MDNKLNRDFILIKSQELVQFLINAHIVLPF